MSRKEKKISIVLPVYNGAEHVSNSIESILSQTYHNWELIIVNDCSTDDTLSVVKEYQEKDSRIKVISNERNLKLPATLNVGFANANGELLTWTSDDNMYKPEALTRMAEELNADPTLAMVYADYTNIDADGDILGTVKIQEPDALLNGNVFGACFLYTADIANAVGTYDVNLFLAEDYEYWIRIYRNGKIRHMHEDLYYYRRHANSLTSTKKKFVNAQTYKAMEKHFLFLYCEAKKHNKQFELFERLLSKIGEEDAQQLKKALSDVDKGYLSYLRKKELLQKRNNTYVWKMFRKMKGIIFR